MKMNCYWPPLSGFKCSKWFSNVTQNIMRRATAWICATSIPTQIPDFFFLFVPIVCIEKEMFTQSHTAYYFDVFKNDVRLLFPRKILFCKTSYNSLIMNIHACFWTLQLYELLNSTQVCIIRVWWTNRIYFLSPTRLEKLLVVTELFNHRCEV